MPSTPDGNSEGENKEVKWITVRGKHIPIKPNEDPEKVIQDKLGTKEDDEETKKFIKRHDLIKTPFDFRDHVYFDDLQKTGTLYGFEGEYLKIRGDDGKNYNKHMSYVFKSSEMINGNHWDCMTQKARKNLLDKAMLSDEWRIYNWGGLAKNIRDKILEKNQSPAGYDGGVSTMTPGVYNPVANEKTVSEKVKDNIESKKEGQNN